jgi:hypothetical protein
VKKAARTATIIGIALGVIALSTGLAMLLRPGAPSSVSAINLRVHNDEGGAGRKRKADRTNEDHGRVDKSPSGSDGSASASDGGSDADRGRDDNRSGADDGGAGGADDGGAGGADDGGAGGADDGGAGGADDGEAVERHED